MARTTIRPMQSLIPAEVRQRALGTLRTEGVTMQAFLRYALRLVGEHDPRVMCLVEDLKQGHE